MSTDLLTLLLWRAAVMVTHGNLIYSLMQWGASTQEVLKYRVSTLIFLLEISSRFRDSAISSSRFLLVHSRSTTPPPPRNLYMTSSILPLHILPSLQKLTFRKILPLLRFHLPFPSLPSSQPFLEFYLSPSRTSGSTSSIRIFTFTPPSTTTSEVR